MMNRFSFRCELEIIKKARTKSFARAFYFLKLFVFYGAGTKATVIAKAFASVNATLVKVWVMKPVLLMITVT